MVVVGFDVGKDSLFAARIDRSLKVKQHYELANTKGAITALLMQLKKKHKHLLIASEATGEYHRTLALTCLSLGISFGCLIPLQRSNMSDQRYTSVKQTKPMLKLLLE